MDRDEQIAELFGRWKAAVRRREGTPPALDVLCADCPELQEDFRRKLPGLIAVDALFNGESRGMSAAALALQFQVPGYDSLTFHREGGLSIVIRAEDVDLKRVVALKWMKDRVALDPAGRQRFLQEAEITATLDHPGIIPVYARGQDADGRHYYVMRFVKGQTLQEAVDAFHAAPREMESPLVNQLAFRSLLRAFITVCETVAYAHAHGVVHRDLKPANLMLGEFNETLVLDWGLAKRLDASDLHRAENQEAASGSDDSGNPGQSIEGSTKGTPGFMSPEQAAGDWSQVGRASDIYSLGATLYAVLTGRAPYQGSTTTEVVNKVKMGVFPPPRRVWSRIPRSLEAVCLKCMSLKPKERYANVRDIAADLERWLADEPVGVWQEPWTLRTRRWMRRHRTSVTAAAVGLMVTTGAALFLAAQAEAHADRLRTANLQLEEEQRQVQAANTNLSKHLDTARKASRSVSSLLDLSVRSKDLDNRELRITLIEEALKINSRLTEEFPKDADYQTEDARAKRHLALQISLSGSESWQRSQSAKAWTEFEQSDRQFRELEQTDHSEEFRELYAIHVRLWGMILDHYALNAFKAGDVVQALTYQERVIGLWEKRVELANDAEATRFLAVFRGRYAAFCVDGIHVTASSATEEIRQAIGWYQRGIDELAKMPAAERESELFKQTLTTLRQRHDELAAALPAPSGAGAVQ